MGCSFRKGIFLKMRNNYSCGMAIPLDKKLTKQWNNYSMGIIILFQGFILHIKHAFSFMTPYQMVEP